MLKPRRANSPAIRVRTPGLFSTRIERMCLRPVRSPPAASSSSSERTSLVPGSPKALAHHVAGRLACRDHRIGVLFPSDAYVDQHRAVGRDRVLHVLDQRLLVFAPMAAGSPNPMVPRPPELIHRRGSRKWKYWAAHIWC